MCSKHFNFKDKFHTLGLTDSAQAYSHSGQIQNLRFCDGRNLADIFSCPDFPVVRLDTMNGFSEWTANVLS